MTMDINYIKGFEPFWGKWYLGSLLGRGTMGTVFQIHTREKEVAALKYIHISFPETIALLSTTDKESYIQDAINSVKQSYTFAHNLRNCFNIVHYDELSIIHESEHSADILIRMELLETLQQHIAQHGITERDVIKLAWIIPESVKLEIAKTHKRRLNKGLAR